MDCSSVEKQVIHSLVACKTTNNAFSFSLCYCFYQVTDRREIWDSFISNVPLDRPALVGGDFNCVMDPDKRVGGQIPLEKE